MEKKCLSESMFISAHASPTKNLIATAVLVFLVFLVSILRYCWEDIEELFLPALY